MVFIYPVRHQNLVSLKLGGFGIGGEGGNKMESLRNFVRGISSLGSGCPYYKHSREREVPWPHLDHPLRNPDESTLRSWERVVEGEELRREIRRLGSLSVSEEEIQGPIISNHVYKPSRVTYSTHIPLKEFDMEILERGVYRWSVYSPDCEPDQRRGSPLPGYICLRELRLKLDPKELQEIDFRLGPGIPKSVQKFESVHLLNFLNRVMGVETITDDLITLPLFFSRDPLYALPLFMVGNLELIVRSKSPPKLYATFDMLHNEGEIKQIKEDRCHRVEDMTNPSNPRVDRWLFMGSYWVDKGKYLETSDIRLFYEGSLDEEIRGIFWDLGEGEVGKDLEVSVEYHYELGRKINLVDPISVETLSELELKTKIIPTMSGSRYTPRSRRGGSGGVLFSRNFDSPDCEPGITPRNGSLHLKFNQTISSLRVYLLTSRDQILVNKNG